MMRSADRRLFLELLRRDLAVRWRGSWLGPLWMVLQPVGWMTLYLSIFSLVLRVPPPAGAEKHGFALFLLVGLIPYLAFQEGVARSASVWLENANLLKKVPIRPSLFVWTMCVSALLLEAISLLAIAGVVASRGLLEPARLPWILVGLIAQLLLTLIPAFLVAILAAFVRDLLLGLPFALTALFYLTPVVYPRDLAPAALRPILDLNPMAWVLLSFRAGLAGASPPTWQSVAIGLPVLAFVALLLGRWADRARPHLADVL